MIRIFTVSFENAVLYNFNDKIADDENDKDVQELFRRLANRRNLAERFGITGFSANTSHYGDAELYPLLNFANGKFACTGDVLVEVMAAGENVKVESCSQSEDGGYADHAERFERILSRMEQQISTARPENNYNGSCEVHMPGQALSTYNETLLLEDSCTDVLQKSLDQGWRVIAACPQPDSRRPDYILGRFNPDIDPGLNAKRRP